MLFLLLAGLLYGVSRVAPGLLQDQVVRRLPTVAAGLQAIGAGKPDALPTAVAGLQATAAGGAGALVEASGPGRATPAPAALAAPDFPTPTPFSPLASLNISNTPGSSDYPDLAFDGAGTLHVVWLDNTPRQDGSVTILHRQMTPDGQWSAVEDLGGDVPYLQEPHLVTNAAGQICLVDGTAGGVYASCYANGRWSPLARAVNEAASTTPTSGLNGSGSAARRQIALAHRVPGGRVQR